MFEIALDSCDGVQLEARSTMDIVEGRISTADQAYNMLSWDFTSGDLTPQLFDGDLGTPVGGDEHGQHDDIVAVKLSGVCQSSSFAVHGEDRDYIDTPLRHVRVAYSMDGRSWSCYTQTDSGSQGGSPPFRAVGAGDTECSAGPSHAPNGAIFNVPFPAQYVEFAFWGQTDIFEVSLDSCLTAQEAAPQSTARVATATWSAESGDENRDEGQTADVFATCNGGDQYVRYRTASSPSFTVSLTLAQPSDVAGISINVRESPDAEGEGYAGIEIAVSSGGALTQVYSRLQMFGNFERHANGHEEMAPDFAMGVPTAFIFDDVQPAVTQIQLTLYGADIKGDMAVSFNQIAVVAEEAQDDHACNIMQARLNAVNEECCSDDDPTCSGGFPSICDQGCAEVFLSFFDECGLRGSPQARTYKSFVKTCRRTVAACGSEGSRCRNGGQCSAIAPGGGHRRTQAETGFMCTCTKGFTGTDCSEHGGRGL